MVNQSLSRRFVAGAVAILAALAILPIQILWRPLEIVTNAPLHALVAVGAFPEGTPRATATYGWGSVPYPPLWFNRVIQLWKWLALETAVAATAITVYHLLFGGYARFRLLDGLTRCGRCGYPLRGVTEPRCPECGAQVGIDDRRGSRWFGGETRRSAAVIVMCLVGFLGLEFAALALDERLFPAISWRWMSAVWYPQNWGTVAALSPLSLLSLGVSLFLTLALYHALALRPRWRSGPTYCGRCGRDIGVVSEPRCPSCSSAF